MQKDLLIPYKTNEYNDLIGLIDTGSINNCTNKELISKCEEMLRIFQYFVTESYREAFKGSSEENVIVAYNPTTEFSPVNSSNMHESRPIYEIMEHLRILHDYVERINMGDSINREDMIHLLSESRKYAQILANNKIQAENFEQNPLNSDDFERDS